MATYVGFSKAEITRLEPDIDGPRNQRSAKDR